MARKCVFLITLPVPLNRSHISYKFSPASQLYPSSERITVAPHSKSSQPTFNQQDSEAVLVKKAPALLKIYIMKVLYFEMLPLTKVDEMLR
jgi:hypothetical protein